MQYALSKSKIDNKIVPKIRAGHALRDSDNVTTC